ncbi:MAG: fibronectin type III domain-containing protein, partial [Spirochaetota bacterium]
LTAPATPTASEATTGSIKVTWQGVDRATGYVLYYRAAAGAGGKFVDVGSRTEYVVEGLASNTSYTFQVAAKAAGFWDSPLSSEASGKTKPQTFTLRFDSKGGSALADMPVTEGKTASKPLSKKDGHFLYGWYMDEGFSKAFDFKDVTAPQKRAQTPPQTLYAKWMDTSGYTVNYRSTGNKHYWAKTKSGSNWTAITDQTVTLEASGVPSGVSSTIYYNNLDLTITETGSNGNKKINDAPGIPKLASVSETGASKYTAAITLKKPETGDNKPKAKVYGLASRVFIEDAHGEQRPAGKMFSEFYFLNDQKGPALIDLKSKETNDDGSEKAGTQVVSGLFVKRGEHVRMRVKTSSETQQILSPDIKVYDSNGNNDKWQTMFNFNKLKTNEMYGLKKATDENSDGDQGETRRKGYMTEVVQKSKSTYTEDNSNYSSINVHFEMQGMQKSLPMQLTETLSSNSPNVNFWVLVE